MALLSSDLIDIFKEGYASNDIEDGLHALRGTGASQAESVRVLMQTLELNLNEADRIVMQSATWADMYDSTIKLRDAFAESLNSIQTENKENDTNESKGNSNSI